MFTPAPQQAPIVPGTTFARPSSSAAPAVSKVFYFFTAGMFLLTLASFGLAAFAFYERDTFAQMVDAKRQELNKITYSQEGATLQDMEDLSGRLKGVVSIFTGAPSASSVFSIFENSVERNVAFNRLDMTRVEGSKTYKVTVAGKAGSLKDLILQRDTLRGAPYSKYIADVVVTNFSRDIENGDVPFAMSMTISVGRFSTGNLLVDLTKPSDNLVPKQTANQTQVVDTSSQEEELLKEVSTTTSPIRLAPKGNNASTSVPAPSPSSKVVPQ